ncbi:MAG: hypothetical protein LBV51_05735 [Acholeplasmatales bacterium]|jgi:hypothetical protein|nr:hypothetical protein [Acholeplasmatales bacterium]
MNKNKTIFILIIISCLCFISSCFDWNHFTYKYYGKNIELWAQAASEVPAFQCDTSKIEIIENDEYGRTLFYLIASFDSAFISDDTIKYQRSITLFICQNYDDKYTYYYPNISSIRKNSKEELEGTLTKQLKNINDWGLPIDLKKWKENKLLMSVIFLITYMI